MAAKSTLYRGFIKEYFTKGIMKPAEIQGAFLEKFNSTQRTFYRHFSKALEEYSATIVGTPETQEQRIQRAAAEVRLNEAVVSRNERLEIATKIARGTVRRVNDQLIIPTDADRLRALDYISKVEGDYAAGGNISFNQVVLGFDPFAQEPIEVDAETED